MPRRRNRKRNSPLTDAGAIEAAVAEPQDVGQEVVQPTPAQEQTRSDDTYDSTADERSNHVEECLAEDDPDVECALPWEVWVCVLSSLKNPIDLASFGLTCRLFHAITQMGTVWRQLLSSTYGWTFDRYQERIDRQKLGWVGAYRVCRGLAHSRVNISRLLQKSPARKVYSDWYLEFRNPFQSFAVECTDALNKPDLVVVQSLAFKNIQLQMWEDRGELSPEALQELQKGTQPDSLISPNPGQYTRGHGENRMWTKTKVLEGHTKAVGSMHLFQGKTRLVTGSADTTIKLWDLEREKDHCVATLRGHTFEVTSVQLNDYLLVSGSQDLSVRLWDVVKGQQVHSFRGHSHFVQDVAINRSGNLLLSGSWDKTVRLWDPRSGECNFTLDLEFSVESVTFSPTEERVYFGPINLSQPTSAPCWVDLRKVESTLRPRRNSPGVYASSPKIAMMPFNLFEGTDVLFSDGGIHKFDSRDAKGKRALEPPVRIGIKEPQKPWLPFSSSFGASWTASGVIVSGGKGKLFFADPTCVPDAPWSDEEAETEAIPRLKKQLHVELLRQPTEEEVARDVRLIQQSMVHLKEEREKREREEKVQHKNRTLRRMNKLN